MSVKFKDSFTHSKFNRPLSYIVSPYANSLHGVLAAQCIIISTLDSSLMGPGHGLGGHYSEKCQISLMFEIQVDVYLNTRLSMKMSQSVI